MTEITLNKFDTINNASNKFENERIFLNYLEFNGIYLNLFEFTRNYMNLVDFPFSRNALRMDKPTDRQTKLLIKLQIATKIAILSIP